MHEWRSSGSLRDLRTEPREASRVWGCAGHVLIVEEIQLHRAKLGAALLAQFGYLRVKLRRDGGFVLVRPQRITDDPNGGFDLAGDAG
jgi:hypothetical protein